MNKFLTLFAETRRADTKSMVSILSEYFESPDDNPVAPQTNSPPCAAQFSEESFFFCNQNIPLRWAPSHMVATATTNGGKSSGCFRPLLLSILPRFKEGRETAERLIIYDAKCDALPFLESLGFGPHQENFYYLNPFDKRSANWLIAAAVIAPAMAWYLANLLVPKERNSTAPFFSDAARLLVFAVVMALNVVFKATWTLRDLLCALDSRINIAAICAHHLPSRVIAESILNDAKHSDGVIGSLATKIRSFSTVAALMATNQGAKSLSIREFLKKPGILVLGNDPVLKDSISPLNSLAIRAIADELLRGPETFMPHTWIIADEFLTLSRQDQEKSIPDLLELGRSKGVSCAIGILSIPGLVSIYGEAEANKILGLCAHKMFLRAGEPQTADWAERFFGRVRRTEATYSYSTGKGGNSTSVSYSVQERPLLLASSFLNIPFPARGRAFKAICDVPSANAITLTSRPFDEILSWGPKPKPETTDYRRDDVNEQTLWPWSEKEREKFCAVTPTIQATRTYLPPRKKKDDPNQTMLF